MGLDADLLANLELAIRATEGHVRKVGRVAGWRGQVPVLVRLQVLERERVTLTLVETQERMQAADFEWRRELPLCCAEQELLIGCERNH